LRIAYLNYGEQSGVTRHVTEALEELGHRVVPVFGRGPLELRDPFTRRVRVTPLVVTHLALAAWRFGRRALSYRWNTPFAFDVHSRWAGELLAGLPTPVDVVLQNGALFAPGAPPRLPFVLYVDHTRAMAERRPAVPAAHLAAPPRWGWGWRDREGSAYRGAASVATFSEHAARSLVDDYAVDGERVHVVGAGTNVLAAEPARSHDGETVVFVGREFDRKGGPILLEAFRQLRRRRPRARLLVAGPPEPIAMPEGAVQLGPVPYERLPQLFAQATVFALPTLREPFGIAFLDAMACGVPCVGTRTEAVPEIIDDGRTGLLVPPGDAIALAVALDHLLSHPALARTMGERGRNRVMGRFTWSNVARRLEILLAGAIERREQPTALAGVAP
jgi:glycosyltransferase involved in cell wall biosynthesis